MTVTEGDYSGFSVCAQYSHRVLKRMRVGEEEKSQKKICDGRNKDR